MARRHSLARKALLATAALALSLARPCAAQPYADERWGPIPPPGKGLRPVETPLCRPRQQGPCEFAFGPDRRLRVPADLLHLTGVGLVRGYGIERRGDAFVRHFPYEHESGLLHLTWAGRRAAARPSPRPATRRSCRSSSRAGAAPPWPRWTWRSTTS